MDRSVLCISQSSFSKACQKYLPGKKHTNFININLLAPRQRSDFGPPQKKNAIFYLQLDASCLHLSFCAYNCVWEPFANDRSFCACSGKVQLISASTDCKQKRLNCKQTSSNCKQRKPPQGYLECRNTWMMHGKSAPWNSVGLQLSTQEPQGPQGPSTFGSGENNPLELRSKRRIPLKHT